MSGLPIHTCEGALQPGVVHVALDVRPPGVGRRNSWRSLSAARGERANALSRDLLGKVRSPARVDVSGGLKGHHGVRVVPCGGSKGPSSHGVSDHPFQRLHVCGAPVAAIPHGEQS